MFQGAAMEEEIKELEATAEMLTSAETVSQQVQYNIS